MKVQTLKEIVTRIILEAGEDKLTNKKIVDKNEAAIKAWAKEQLGENDSELPESANTSPVNIHRYNDLMKSRNQYRAELRTKIDAAK